VAGRDKHLRDALVDLGVSPDDIDALEKWQPYTGLGLAERVYRSGLVSDHRLVEAFVSLGATDATSKILVGMPSPAALGAFPRALAAKHRALPFELDRRRVVTALLDPSDTVALEKLSLTSGVIVEPRACRPRVLFEALARAYGLTVVRPDGAFLESRRTAAPLVDPDLEAAIAITESLSPTFPKPRPEPSSSAKVALAEPAISFATTATTTTTARASSEASAQASTPHLDLRPAHSPGVSSTTEVDRAVRAEAVAGRDTLPPMVLSMLVPPLRCCALFLVRARVAVGWDVMTRAGSLSTTLVRDVLVPLTAESVLATAVTARRVAIGNARDPSTTERSLFRLLRLPPPRCFVALPIVVGDDVTTVLYGDRDDGEIDDGLLDEMRRVGSALGDALAPLHAAGLLGSASTTRP
jgi:hypothetical protein